MAQKQQEKQEQGQQLQARGQRGGVRPFEDFERLYEGFGFPRGWMRPFFRGLEWPFEALPSVSARLPAIDVIDRENEILVRAEVPGVKKEDLEVSVSDHTLTIRGSSKEEKKEEKEEYYRQEMSYGGFSRQVLLPENVDTNKVKATMKNGVLELTLPKLEGAKRKSIQIEAQ